MDAPFLEPHTPLLVPLAGAPSHPRTRKAIGKTPELQSLRAVPKTPVLRVPGCPFKDAILGM